jgi:soluble lytic murein transglycosylase-like protein
MAIYKTLRIRVPDIKTPFKSGSTNYSNPATKAANAEVIRDIKSTYAVPINRWGVVFEIPDAIIIGFIATESGGRMLGANVYKATGLMQVTPNALWECVKKWDSTVKTALPAQAVAELKRKVPEIFTSSAVAPSATVSNKIIKLLQNDANFNIMSGTLILRWLIERFSTVQTGGQLNKAMVAYNAGAYIRALNVSSTQPITNPIDSTSLATNRLVPAESRGYLYKMLGKDGFLSLIYIDKVV